MTTDARAIADGEPDLDDEVIIVAPTALSGSTRGRILLYLSLLILMLGFGAPYTGLIDIPIQFFLKNRLHLTPVQLAIFRLAAGVPLYLSSIFGFVRDTWNPFGRRDRGYFVIFGALTAALYVAFAFAPISYIGLLSAVVLISASFLFVASAQSGLTSAIGQQNVMSGQVSTVWNIFLSVPGFAAFFLGGMLSQMLEGKQSGQAIRILFLVGAAVMAAVALYGIWKPKFVFGHVHAERTQEARRWDDVKRLLRHRAIYPALLIWFLWNFAPGSQTPLQYYMQDTLHANDAQWGDWNAIFAAFFIPTFLVYGVLCTRYSLRPLLFWGTIVAVPQMVPLLFIHSATGALIAAAPIGLMGGVATAAYYDLLIRSCPAGLQGTILMMSTALYYIVSRVGDVLGTYLYHIGGFGLCVGSITLVYALILPTLLMVPKRLTSTADGQVLEGGFTAE